MPECLIIDRQPFIKGETGKTGWDVIRAGEEQAQESSTITFDMGSGILWSVDGKSVTADKAGDIDFSVKTETNENAGYTASLYYYNESTGELEFICSDEVAEDGTISLAFTHASDYVIAIDGEQEEESGNAAEPAQPENQDGDSTEAAEESPQTRKAWRPWWPIAVGALVIIMGVGVFFAVKKRRDGDSGQ